MDTPEDEGGDEGSAGFRQVSTEDSCRADHTAPHRAQTFGCGAIPEQGSNNSSHSTCSTRRLCYLQHKKCHNPDCCHSLSHVAGQLVCELRTSSAADAM